MGQATEPVRDDAGAAWGPTQWDVVAETITLFAMGQIPISRRADNSH